MKKIITSSFLFVCLVVNSQGVITPSWMIIDSSSNGLSEAWGIDVDSDHHIYWALNNNVLNQGLDINCYKFEYGGNPLWNSQLLYGGSGAQQAYICNANDTALYIGGRACSGLVTTCDMLLLKVDKSSGTLIWDQTKNFSANGYDEIDGLEIKSDGIYTGGWCQELNGSIYRSDIGLWKLDFNGNTQWTNYIGDNTTAEHQDGHFVVDNDGIYAAGLWGGQGIANLYNGHSFLGKFDKTNGSLIDSTLFGNQSSNFNDIENALGMTSDGTFLYITGYTILPGSTDWQLYVAKYDKNFNQIWYTDWGSTGTETARGIKVENETIYVAGLTESASLMNGGGGSDAVLLKLDTSGNVLNYQTYGGLDTESFQDLAVKDGNVYLVGTIENASNEKKAMLLAIENSATGYSESEISLQNNFLVYPNPSNGNTTVEFDKVDHEGGMLVVYSADGKQVLKRSFSSSDNSISLTINTSGVFIVEAIFPKYSIRKKIINKI